MIECLNPLRMELSGKTLTAPRFQNEQRKYWQQIIDLSLASLNSYRNSYSYAIKEDGEVLLAVAKELGVSVSFAPIDQEHLGKFYAHFNEIVVHSGYSERVQFMAFVHELTHAIRKHYNLRKTNRHLEEVMTQATTWAFLHQRGHEGYLDFTIGYLGCFYETQLYRVTSLFGNSELDNNFEVGYNHLQQQFEAAKYQVERERYERERGIGRDFYGEYGSPFGGSRIQDRGDSYFDWARRAEICDSYLRG